MRNKLKLVLSVLFVTGMVVGVTYAVFSDKATILGTSFSVGSADIKLLDDLALGIDAANLVEEKDGPTFTGISPNWEEDYMLKIYNNALSEVMLSSHADYETANDPDDLRQIIYVEPFLWDDVNSDGIVDGGELGASLGRKTIVKWKTVGYELGILSSGEVKSLVLRFSTDSVAASKQGKSAIIDFEFDAEEVE